MLSKITNQVVRRETRNADDAVFKRHQMKKKTKSFISVLFVLAIVITYPAFSHALKQTSAQIILRDGQVELRLYIDQDQWLEKLQDHQAWLTGVNSVLITANDLSSPDLEEKLANVILSETAISLDGTIAQLTANKITSDPLSDHFIEYRFSAPHRLKDPNAIEVKFPESLADVHLSIVRPIYRNVTQGDTVSIHLE